MHTKMPAIALSAMLLLAACDDTASAPTAPGAQAAKGGASTPLGMTVQDQGPSGAYRIYGDGKGEYVNGVDGIGAVIDTYGNLEIGPTAVSTSQVRTLKFDFSAPADPSNTYRPDESLPQQQWKIKTNPNVVAGTPKITDLGVNGNPASGCYGSTIAHQNGVTHHRVIWNTASDPQSTNVYITRTSATTWTVVSNGPCAGNPDWGAVYSMDLTRKNAPLVYRGLYNLRFALALRSL